MINIWYDSSWLPHSAIYYINSALSAGCPHAQWSRTGNPRQTPLLTVSFIIEIYVDFPIVIIKRKYFGNEHIVSETFVLHSDNRKSSNEYQS